MGEGCFGFGCPPALVGRGELPRLLNGHFSLVTLDRPFARLGAEHHRPTGLALVSSSQLIRHNPRPSLMLLRVTSCSSAVRSRRSRLPRNRESRRTPRCTSHRNNVSPFQLPTLLPQSVFGFDNYIYATQTRQRNSQARCCTSLVGGSMVHRPSTGSGRTIAGETPALRNLVRLVHPLN